MDDRLRAELVSAVSGASSALDAADQLCAACVELLEVDGACLSLTLDGESRGTLGASSDRSRHVSELQFTTGQGPCLDAVATGSPVLVPDLDDPGELRWPGFTGAVLAGGIRAVFALPVSLSRQRVGALDLYRSESGPLSADALSGGLLAAELATLPLLDLIAEHRARTTDEAADGLDARARPGASSYDRVEVYQATGMIMGALDVDSVEALVRMRAQAFLRCIPTTELAWEIVERRVSLDSAEWQEPDSMTGPHR